MPAGRELHVEDGDYVGVFDGAEGEPARARRVPIENFAEDLAARDEFTSAYSPEVITMAEYEGDSETYDAADKLYVIEG